MCCLCSSQGGRASCRPRRTLGANDSSISPIISSHCVGTSRQQHTRVAVCCTPSAACTHTPCDGRSRYIDAGTDTQGDTTYKMHEHYMFIEAEHNPEQAPVLLWSNGGEFSPRLEFVRAAVLPAPLTCRCRSRTGGVLVFRVVRGAGAVHAG